MSAGDRDGNVSSTLLSSFVACNSADVHVASIAGLSVGRVRGYMIRIRVRVKERVVSPHTLSTMLVHVGGCPSRICCSYS